MGINKFVLQADAPDISQIPEGDILGVTVVLVTCSYREKEFVRVGYYVNNEYTEPYDEEAGPPKPLDMNKVRRCVLSEKPRVTRFPIQWGDKEVVQQQQQQNGENAEGQLAAAQQQQSGQGQSMGGQMLEEAKGMAFVEMGDEDIEDEDFEEEEDDVSVEGKDMMMEDAMIGGNQTAVTAAME